MATRSLARALSRSLASEEKHRLLTAAAVTTFSHAKSTVCSSSSSSSSKQTQGWIPGKATQSLSLRSYAAKPLYEKEEYDVEKAHPSDKEVPRDIAGSK